MSLHQVDTILHRREIASVQASTVIECLLLLVAAAATAWVPRGVVRENVATSKGKLRRD